MNRCPIVVLCFWGSSLAVPAAAQGSLVHDAHAIVNVKIVVGDGTVIDRGRVVVRDGVVEIVDDRTNAPPDALVFDATGLTVYPGFIDAFAAAGVRGSDLVGEGAPFDATAAASARMRETHRKGIRPDLSAVDALDLSDEISNPRRQAGFTHATFAPSPAILGGRAALADLSGGPRRDVLLRLDVAMAAELRAPAGEGYPGSTMGAIAQLRQALYDADWYRRAWKAHRDRPRELPAPPIDIVLASLEPVLERGLPIVFTANTKTEILRALRFAEETNTRPWIAGGTGAWECASVLTQKGIPVLLTLDFGAEPKDPKPPTSRGAPESAPESGPASRPDSTWPNPDELPARAREERMRRYRERVANAAALVKAGVQVAITTAGTKGGADFHAALAKAVEAGLAREAALDALTRVPADLLGAGSELGRIAPGRRAAFSVVKGSIGDKEFVVRALFVGVKRFDYEEDGSEAPASGPASGRRRPRDGNFEGEAFEGDVR